jgi:hypothetical protein
MPQPLGGVACVAWRGVLASQCLDRRIADKQILAHEVNAWQDHRNKQLS